MTCQYYGCRRAGTIDVNLDFKPGGAQTLHLCADHSWDMYVTVVKWFGSGVPPVSDCAKNACLNDHVRGDVKVGMVGKL